MHDKFYYDYDLEEQRKYAIKYSRTEYVWLLKKDIDYSDFDFRFIPDKHQRNSNHAWNSHNNENCYSTWLVNINNISSDTVFHSSQLVGQPPNIVYWDEFNKENITNWTWVIDRNISYTNFNFNWLPDTWDTNYIHAFAFYGTNTLSKTWLVNPNSIKENNIKYHNSNLSPNISMVYYEPPSVDTWTWICDPAIDYVGFDFTWLPEAGEENYIHAFVYNGSNTLSNTFLVSPGTIRNKKIKYHSSNLILSANRVYWPNFVEEKIAGHKEMSDWLIKQNITDDWYWVVDTRIDYTNFDFNWRPDQADIEYTHCFTVNDSNQISYTWLVNRNGLSKKKYKFHESSLTMPVVKKYWDGIGEESDMLDWIKQANYSEEWVWMCHDNIDYSNFNFNWMPDSWDQDYVHCFTMKNNDKLSYTWLVNTAAIDRKKVKYHTANLIMPVGKMFWPRFIEGELHGIDWNDMMANWLIDQNLEYDYEWLWICDERTDYTDFNFEWLPDNWGRNYIHCFTAENTTQLSSTWLINTTTLKNKKYKLLTSQLSIAVDKIYWPDYADVPSSGYDFNDNLVNWLQATNQVEGWSWILDKRINYDDFNFNWLPDDWDQENVHCFTLKNNDQLSYTWLVNPTSLYTRKFKYRESDLKLDVKRIYWPNFNDIALTGENWQDSLVKWIEEQNLSNDWYWVCDSRIDYTDFNFDWLPDNWEQNYIHCFTLANTKQLSYTWLINPIALSNRKYKLHESDLVLSDEYFDRIYWPNFMDVYLTGDDWQDSLTNWLIEQNLPDKWIWVCDTRINYNKFDFKWLPDDWDQEYIHCFAIKDKDKLSYTWLVNPTALKNRKYKYHATDLELNSYDIIELDMLNANGSKYKLQRFLGDMISALKTAVKKTNKEWLWVISNNCKYHDFDFNWTPDLNGIEYTHCWPSGKQEKGETFLIHVPSYNQSMEFKFNFEHQSVERYHWPTVYYNEDSLAQAIANNKPKAIYTLYIKRGGILFNMPEPCLWEKRPVVGMSECNSVSLVPRDCVVKEEIYEYPHLMRDTLCANPVKMDIVFLHNGEKDANGNYVVLQGRLVNRNVETHIVTKVTPRLKAYQEAARRSNTDWFLAVFAKCSMLKEFENFHWVPDYWQKAKHYIFYNHNTNLDITYGHMAPIAYNKRLMLENKGGLDMTMVQDHATVPIVLSQTYLDDPWDAWRTAFRETAKLLYFTKDNSSIEAIHRLDVWLDAKDEWFAKGANDAKNYFESTDGNYEWLMLTSEWDWLYKKFTSLYSADLTT